MKRRTLCNPNYKPEQKAHLTLNLPDARNCSASKDFTQIPNQLLRNPDISGKAKALLCVLLSNKEGWHTYLTSLRKTMKEGVEALRSGVKELEEHNYLLRIKYKNKQTKQYAGAFWAYTDVPGDFNLTNSLKLLESAGMEPIMPDNPDAEKPYTKKPDTAFSDTGNPPLRILKDNNTNSNNTNFKNINLEEKDIYLQDKKPDKKTNPPIKDRNEKYLPLAQQLAETIQSVRNIFFSAHQIAQWGNEVRQLSELNKVEYDRIKNALDWYKDNVGGEYVPVIESGASLRSKFIKLEAAINRSNGKFRKTSLDNAKSDGQPYPAGTSF
jgi:hypothetical protein